MSADNPTHEEIDYLASLSAVRTDGVDVTQPALARIIKQERAAHTARLAALDAEIEKVERAVLAEAEGMKIDGEHLDGVLAGLRRAREIITGAKP